MSKKTKVEFKKVTKDDYKFLVDRIYKNIFRLDTKTLSHHEHEVFKELISRKDYDELDFLITKYHILQDELLRRGVNLDV